VIRDLSYRSAAASQRSPFRAPRMSSIRSAALWTRRSVRSAPISPSSNANTVPPPQITPNCVGRPCGASRSPMAGSASSCAQPVLAWRSCSSSRRLGNRGNGRGGAALDRRAGEGETDGDGERTAAWAACVRCGELSGAKVICSSLSQTRMSPAVGEQLMQQGSPLLIDTGICKACLRVDRQHWTGVQAIRG
jgi:hypothetical protein